jgi:hypothetical protein
VTISSPADGATAIAGAPVSFAGTATDSEEGDLSASLLWSSSADGPLGSGAGLTRSDLSVGAHTITARVTDAGGLQANDQITLIISINTSPDVTITAPPDGTVVAEGASITLQGAATDLEDGNLSANLSWLSNLDGQLGSGASMTRSDLSPGTHTITAFVTDSGGLGASDQIALAVSANTPPIVTITAPPDATIIEFGETIAFTATAADAQDGDLSAGLVWTSDRDGPLGTGAAIATSDLSRGLHGITASVTDAGGLTSSAATNLEVVLPAGSVFFDQRVSASSDDAEEDVDGDVTLDSSDLELVFDDSDQIVGVRFDGVAIPARATILEASVRFQVDEESSEATSLSIEAEAADQAAPFQEAPADISSRPRTSASVAWVPAAWPDTGASGVDQQTPDLAALIQEIVNRPGWSSGNALVILIRGTGHRVAESFDGAPEAAALLHVGFFNGPPRVEILAPRTVRRWRRASRSHSWGSRPTARTGTCRRTCAGAPTSMGHSAPVSASRAPTCRREPTRLRLRSRMAAV